MEQWRREVGRELSSLRGHITRATSLGNLEERCVGVVGRNCRLWNSWLIWKQLQFAITKKLEWHFHFLGRQVWKRGNDTSVLSSFPLFSPLSFNSKIRREELEHLRREVDQLKTRLSESHVGKHTYIMSSHWFCGTPHVLSSVLACQAKDKYSLAHGVGSFFFCLTGRQEEDVFLQQAEARETRRQYERSCKVHTQCNTQLVFACVICGL